MAGKARGMKQQGDASDIVKLLKDRHSDDVFVPECTVGPVGARLDGWAMVRSWANPRFIGYEVKVSRSDFLHDNKWTKYLPFCTEFYFVCPWGLIDSSEIGDRCGLMYAAKNGNRLIIKKKAPVLEDLPVERQMLMAAVLMTRVKIVPSTFNKKTGLDDSEFWEKWLEAKDHWKIVGRSVSKELNRRVDEKITKISDENFKLQQQNHSLEKVKEFLNEHDIDLSSYNLIPKLSKKIFRDFQLIGTEIDRSIRSLQSVKKAIEEETERK